jgi:hypothetical protein
LGLHIGSYSNQISNSGHLKLKANIFHRKASEWRLDASPMNLISEVVKFIPKLSSWLIRGKNSERDMNNGS